MDPAEPSKETEKSTLQSDSAPNTGPSPVVVRREPERDLISWVAPARPFQRKTRQFYTTVFAIAGIISLVLFLAEGLMPVVLIVALVFLYYVLSTVPPENIEYKITSKGIKIAGKLTEWQSLIRFWFTANAGNEILIFETVLIPGRIEIMITPEIKADLKREISAYIPFEEITASGLDKVTNWIAQKLPGNK